MKNKILLILAMVMVGIFDMVSAVGAPDAVSNFDIIPYSIVEKACARGECAGGDLIEVTPVNEFGKTKHVGTAILAKEFSWTCTPTCTGGKNHEPFSKYISAGTPFNNTTINDLEFAYLGDKTIPFNAGAQKYHYHDEVNGWQNKGDIDLDTKLSLLNTYEKVNVLGSSFYIHKDLLTKVEAGKRAFLSINNYSELVLVTFDPNEIDLFVEGTYGEVDGYSSTIKYGAVQLYGEPVRKTDTSIAKIGMKFLTPNSSNKLNQHSDRIFFLCSSCWKCEKCDDSHFVASNGATMNATSANLMFSKGCAQEHACGFFWTIDNSGSSHFKENIEAGEGVDCIETKEDISSPFCKSHTCLTCGNKAVIGVSLSDARFDYPVVYTGSDASLYSMYCTEHFCWAYMCKAECISTDGIEPQLNTAGDAYVDFPQYCMGDHSDNCGIQGCPNVVSKAAYEAVKKNVCESCQKLNIEKMKCYICGNSYLDGFFTKVNGNNVCRICVENKLAESGYDDEMWNELGIASSEDLEAVLNEEGVELENGGLATGQDFEGNTVPDNTKECPNCKRFTTWAKDSEGKEYCLNCRKAADGTEIPEVNLEDETTEPEKTKKQCKGTCQKETEFEKKDGKWTCTVCGWVEETSSGTTTTPSAGNSDPGGGSGYGSGDYSGSGSSGDTTTTVDPTTCVHSNYPVPNTVTFSNVTATTHVQTWTCINCKTVQTAKYEHTFINKVCVCGEKQDEEKPSVTVLVPTDLTAAKAGSDVRVKLTDNRALASIKYMVIFSDSYTTETKELEGGMTQELHIGTLPSTAGKYTLMILELVDGAGNKLENTTFTINVVGDDDEVSLPDDDNDSDENQSNSSDTEKPKITVALKGAISTITEDDSTTNIELENNEASFVLSDNVELSKVSYTCLWNTEGKQEKNLTEESDSLTITNIPKKGNLVLVINKLVDAAGNSLNNVYFTFDFPEDEESEEVDTEAPKAFLVSPEIHNQNIQYYHNDTEHWINAQVVEKESDNVAINRGPHNNYGINGGCSICGYTLSEPQDTLIKIRFADNKGLKNVICKVEKEDENGEITEDKTYEFNGALEQDLEISRISMKSVKVSLEITDINGNKSNVSYMFEILEDETLKIETDGGLFAYDTNKPTIEMEPLEAGKDVVFSLLDNKGLEVADYAVTYVEDESALPDIKMFSEKFYGKKQATLEIDIKSDEFIKTIVDITVMDIHNNKSRVRYTFKLNDNGTINAEGGYYVDSSDLDGKNEVEIEDDNVANPVLVL